MTEPKAKPEVTFWLRGRRFGVEAPHSPEWIKEAATRIFGRAADASVGLTREHLVAIREFIDQVSSQWTGDPRLAALAEALAGQGVEAAYFHPIAPPHLVFVGAADRDALSVPVILRAARLALDSDDVRISFVPATRSLDAALIRLLPATGADR